MDATAYKKYEPFWGSWYITQKLGEGSYGTVFEVTSGKGNAQRREALKIITVPKSESDLNNIIMETGSRENARTYLKDITNEMFREIELMAKLRGGANIVGYEGHKVIEHAGAIGWDIFIRMELLTPLDKWLQDNSYSERSVVQLGIDICKALELCQRHKIIHRDIKPANIFVDDSGNFKLGDFGIARTAEKSTGASTRVGTTSYMAPEILRSEKYGSSVDIYSLGIVLYQLLNDSRLPFMPPAPMSIGFDDKDKSMAMRMRGEPMPRPSHSQGRIGDIVLKACAFRPQDRYSSPAQMRADLERALPLASTEALNTQMQELPDSSVKKPKKKSKTPVIIAVAAAAVCLCVLLGIGIYSMNSSISKAKASTSANLSASESAAGIQANIGSVSINEKNFPDEAFRTYVSENFDADKDGKLYNTDIAGVTEINVDGKNIASLRGVEYFTALTSLSCADNGLTELDISRNTALVSLNCSGNDISRLDITSNGKLETLDCDADVTVIR